MALSTNLGRNKLGEELRLHPVPRGPHVAAPGLLDNLTRPQKGAVVLPGISKG
jgi:hypothetical protein